MADIKSSNEQNQGLVDHFIGISDKYLQTGDKRRFSTFKKVANILAGVEEVIDAGHDITEYPGVGNSSWEIQQQFLSTGNSDRMAEVEELVHESQAVLVQLPLEDQVGRALQKRGVNEGEAVSAFVLWGVTAGFESAGEALECLDTAPSFLLDNGLESVLIEIAGK